MLCCYVLKSWCVLSLIDEIILIVIVDVIITNIQYCYVRLRSRHDSRYLKNKIVQNPTVFVLDIWP